MGGPSALTVDRVRDLGQRHVHLDADPTYARVFVRRISPFLTWAIVRFTGLSADAVTGLAITSGVVGGLLAAVPSIGSNIAAILLLQVAYLLDVSDGEVARVRGTSGRRGTYLDLIGHVVQNRALYGASTYVLIVVSGYAWWAIAVAMAGVAFASPFGEQARAQVLGHAAASGAHTRATPTAGTRPSAAGRLYRAYRAVAFIWDYPASMNLFCVALAGDAIRFAIDGGAEPLVLPAFAGAFAITLFLKQITNALRLLSPRLWT